MKTLLNALLLISSFCASGALHAMQTKAEELGSAGAGTSTSAPSAPPLACATACAPVDFMPGYIPQDMRLYCIDDTTRNHRIRGGLSSRKKSNPDILTRSSKQTTKDAKTKDAHRARLTAFLQNPTTFVFTIADKAWLNKASEILMHNDHAMTPLQYTTMRNQHEQVVLLLGAGARADAIGKKADLEHRSGMPIYPHSPINLAKIMLYMKPNIDATVRENAIKLFAVDPKNPGNLTELPQGLPPQDECNAAFYPIAEKLQAPVHSDAPMDDLAEAFAGGVMDDLAEAFARVSAT